jgi:hypothetical protein
MVSNGKRIPIEQEGRSQISSTAGALVGGIRVAAGQTIREGPEMVYESALDVADRAVNSATK